MRPRLGRGAELLERHRQIEVPVGVLRVEGQRPPVALAGLGESSDVVEHVGAVVVRLEEVGCEAARLLVERERFWQMSLA